MTISVNDNVVRWSDSFLSQRVRAESKEPLMGITFGSEHSADPSEMVVVAAWKSSGGSSGASRRSVVVDPRCQLQ